MTPEQFKEARKRLGLTQRQMGEALRLRGTPDNRGRTVRGWEKGEWDITGPVTLAVELLLIQHEEGAHDGKR